MTEATLQGELARIRSLVAPQLGEDNPPGPSVSPQPWESLTEIFGLSEFERDLLLLCVLSEMDGSVERPTAGLALATLPKPHWDAFAPGGPLRRWHLVELGSGSGLTTRTIRLDERVLQHLLGVSCLDERLDGLVTLEHGGALTEGQAALAAELAGVLASHGGSLAVVLEGSDTASRARVAASVANRLGRGLLRVRMACFPALGADLVSAARLLEREVALLPGLPLLDCAPGDDARAVETLIDCMGCPVLVSQDLSVPLAIRTAQARRSVPVLTPAERHAKWVKMFGDIGANLARHYRFAPAMVEEIAAQVGPAPEETVLREACRHAARQGMDGLAERIQCQATWEDLILPEFSMAQLQNLVRQVRHRATVYDDWGLATPGERGLGITALFTGDSGTGKTLAAEVLAHDLGLDLYRVDLSAVVSKYIGETEKNLRKVFDAAQAGGAVLLFDEADALFGKRSEVRDSHDRYANLEIAYLLQRMENYHGLAVLTTNVRSALDQAFLRRLRFIVTFPFPDAQARAAIWDRMFPPALPLSDVDLSLLARLQISGGTIRAIALNAAFAAAETGGPMTMTHLLEAARQEYAKTGKPLTEAEIGGWR